MAASGGGRGRREGVHPRREAIADRAGAAPAGGASAGGGPYGAAAADHATAGVGGAVRGFTAEWHRQRLCGAGAPGRRIAFPDHPDHEPAAVSAGPPGAYSVVAGEFLGGRCRNGARGAAAHPVSATSWTIQRW